MAENKEDVQDVTHTGSEIPTNIPTQNIHDLNESDVFSISKIPTLDEISKQIDKCLYKVDRYKFLADLFECGAIAISNQCDFRKSKKREERYKQIMDTYDLEGRKAFADVFGKIFALLSSMSLRHGKLDDYLGELYMMSNTSSSKHGQFFTPYNVSNSCAELCISGDIVEGKKRTGEILTLCESSCGSGGMLLAVLNILWNRYDFNYAMQCFIGASDIDKRCVHMCYLQLSLAGVPAIIKHQDALTLECWDVWKTPAYLMQYSKFRRFDAATF